ncbi:hypothetical protein EI94DRAFT_1736145 [Lactarius quietus]|nr:hypothetical protein EI94DRAFT_1736145 [Lactarius quietus]
MAPKGQNTKKESGRAKKADNEAKQRAAAEEAKAGKWADGSKSSKSKEDKEEKRKAEIARKAENARLLEEEEAALRVKRLHRRQARRKGSPRRECCPSSAESPSKEPQDVESFAATGIDNALDLLEVVTAKMDKASVGNQAAGIEKHPEAAFNAYVDRELPNIREEDILFKQFQKSPENPFNQSTVDYNATNEEKVEVLRRRQDEVRERLREKSP